VKSAEESIAEIHAIAQKVNDMRNRAPADDPLQAVAFRLAALCGKVEAHISSNVRAAKRAGVSVEEYVRSIEQ
jgi:hypothetical protein